MPGSPLKRCKRKWLLKNGENLERQYWDQSPVVAPHCQQFVFVSDHIHVSLVDEESWGK
jgi:hypothetical protein